MSEYMRVNCTVGRHGRLSLPQEELISHQYLLRSYSVIVGDGNTIVGHHNIIRGNNNKVTGNHNVVNGHHCVITGNHNTITGDYARCTGNHNRIYGRYHRESGGYNEKYETAATIQVGNGQQTIFGGSAVQLGSGQQTIFGGSAMQCGSGQQVIFGGDHHFGEQIPSDMPPTDIEFSPVSQSAPKFSIKGACSIEQVDPTVFSVTFLSESGGYVMVGDTLQDIHHGKGKVSYNKLTGLQTEGTPATRVDLKSGDVVTDVPLPAPVKTPPAKKTTVPPATRSKRKTVEAPKKAPKRTKKSDIAFTLPDAIPDEPLADKNIGEEWLCSLCELRPKNCTTECGHIISCVTCALEWYAKQNTPAGEKGKCMVCSAEISYVRRIYLPNL